MAVRPPQEWHPDKNPDNVEAAQAKFTEIGNAYEILSTERRQYDQLLRSPFGRGGFQHNFYRPQQHWQQQHWQRQQQGGSPLGGLMGMLVPLGILMYMLNSQFNGGGAAAPRSGNKKKAADDDDDKEEERTPPDRLPKGTRVQVQGLQSAAAAVLNGTRGGVVRPRVPTSSCLALPINYACVLTASGKPVLQMSYDPDKARYIVQLAAKPIGEHTSLAPKNVQQIVYGARILRGFRSIGAGDGDSGTTSTTNLAGHSCRVVGSAEVAESGDWEHLVELNDDKECTPLAELTRLPPDAIKLPVCTAADLCFLLT